MQTRILGAMKAAVSIFTVAAVVAGGLLVLSPGCEEVLDICSPCGSFIDGDVTISGDPSLDGTLMAVQQIRRFAQTAASAFEYDISILAETFGVPKEAGTTELLDEIQKQLFENPGVKVVIAFEPSQCWTGKELAIAAELSCEKRLECRIKKTNPPSCSGLFVGKCDARCLGRCFEKTLDDDLTCTTECIGACSELNRLQCPGVCSGSCSGLCSSYNSRGNCSGRCDGMCTGICESPLPFACNGLCHGLCQVDLEEGHLCRDQCRGSCLDQNDKGVGEGICRGHLRPAGYDGDCGECREMAKGLAWSTMVCGPSSIRVGVNFTANFTGDRGAFLGQARILERILSRVAEDHAKLSLLVDGVDDTGELDPEDLVEVKTTEDFGEKDLKDIDYLGDEEHVAELGVVPLRKYLPLSNLKARVGELATTATEGDFKVAASTLSCVTTAFEESKELLAEMIPTTETDASVEADRSCSKSNDQTTAPCLYQLVDNQAALLELTRTGE
ncbi:MAG: hypothetical protein GY847_24225 [Proteobacteria bacterium]|nr:hypothetical protein [Pseudomonadota bacterium]